MAKIRGKQAGRPSWRELVEGEAPLLLPAAHDGLAAKIIERAGFKAYQVGGFALAGARHGFPDIDLVHYGEQSAGVRDTIAASSLPVLIDGDDCYGDVKNVARTIHGYETLGVSAIFFEDQVAPKRCGHMQDKEVIPAEAMVSKVKAAAGVRKNPDTFLIARTDARAPLGLDEALRRAELYVKAGADGIFIEAPQSLDELEKIGKSLKGVPKVANMLEGGGATPICKPEDLHAMGFSMILYPTSILFRVTLAIERAAADILAGRPMDPKECVDFKHFEEIVSLDEWAELEKRFGKG